MQLERTVLISAPVDEVFDFLADGPRCTAWRDGVREIARMTTASGAGAVYRQVVSGPGGRDIDSDVLVTAYDPPHRLDEAIAATRHAGDVPGPIATASQRAPKIGDLHAHVGLDDIHSRPSDGHQLLGSQDRPTTLDHRNQHVERATPQRNERAVLA